jgi:hypothetical protein
LTGPLTGVRPRPIDRARLVGRALGYPSTLLVRAVVLLVAIVGWLGWDSSVSDPILALVTIALLALLAWTARAAWWLTHVIWEEEQLDLPRRLRRIDGPGPGIWATDIVPYEGRYGVLVLHYGRLARPTPPTAPNAPSTPWGRDASVRSGTTRTVVAFEWAADEATAESAVKRLTDASANRMQFAS